MLGLLIWGYIVFIGIYFSGKKTMFYIDRFGEANIELVIIPVFIFCCILGFYFLIKSE